ncbi:MAG TPA: KH domain-containing protein [Kiritimatiellia bacterium]|nr:KH domain-containing protein [Kiritimatiellia bacterium]HNR93914.1 KH domain-containing protein [Kiritimatiellia bacterium]HNS80799.1 KH domain-containing protein [Kiritimatiellia bacterium]HPA77176.1 KH domain-containing protein [Kiritimatiellia bacterium]HQQ04969.1 KH domain-containing protein [Kiritimatiellia bacterium]
MKELIEYIVRILVDHPEQVQITEVDGEKTVIFELRCNKEDIGKIIGKSGKTVGAIRTLLSTAAAKDGRRALLEIVD